MKSRQISAVLFHRPHALLNRMELKLLVKNAKFQTPSKEYLPGALSVSKTRVQWDASISVQQDLKPINVLLASISNQQRAKGKPFLRIVCPGQEPPACVFEFDTEADRDTVVDCIAKAQTAQQTGDGSPASCLKPQQRQALFASNPDLQEEHRALVASGILSDADFWARKMSMPQFRHQQESVLQAASASGAAAVAGRTIGISNNMVDMQGEQDAKAASVGRSKVQFHLTPELIKQIFAERPHVKRAYVKNVPHNMSEKVFWTKYAQYQLSNEVKRKRLLEGQGYDDTPADEDARLFRPGFQRDSAGAAVTAAQSDVDEQQRLAKIICVNPRVNLLAHESDSLMQGFGVVHATSKDPGVPGMAEDLVRDINRHAEVVLAGREALLQAADMQQQQPVDERGLKDVSIRSKQEEYLQLEDLRPLPQDQFEPLNIADPSRYFDRQGTHISGQTDGSQPGKSLIYSNTVMRISFVDPTHLSEKAMDPQLAYEALILCTRGISSALREGSGMLPRSTLIPDPLSDELLLANVRSVVRPEAVAVNELCRHFWSCFPTDSPSKVPFSSCPYYASLKRSLLSKLHQEIDQRWKRVEDMRQLQRPDRLVFRHLLKPLRDMLEAAMARYRQEVHP
ncbi:hypothetical protein CEUSTIGMA_g3651.t1 [Chlamydomonas eustigma]|uniref:BSD domain-containing protein n=1 Tax=Chlamydomonas eustigma TaxID=1157962 RepID=A0A250WZE1_9CHLO|nr:hypothetical protein CEUSTIGMA_g3651.t1 [Chlamydomonas eustigma]|eukprot:GAX76207.1 hypothetical protein CEUSTIGMA_g3651.t1 [Chlamydomonas eustigma]